MSQVTTYTVPNSVGATFRSNINNILGAIHTMNSGSAAPSSPVEGMLWYDTDTNIVAIYNGSSFVNLIDVDGTDWLGSAATLTTARTIDITGDITATAVAFDGSANIAISAAVNNDSHSHTGSTISALDAGDTTTGTFSPSRLATDTAAAGEVLTANSANSASWQAAAGGLGNIETFTVSGTWDWAAAGSPSDVWVCLQGGGGGAAREKAYKGGGGAGGTIMWRKIAVSANVTVTIGAAGASDLQGTGGDKSVGASASAGGTTSFGGTSVGGGAGGIASNGNGGSGGTGTGSGGYTGQSGSGIKGGSGNAVGGCSPFGARGAGGSSGGGDTSGTHGDSVSSGAGIVVVVY